MMYPKKDILSNSGDKSYNRVHPSEGIKKLGACTLARKDGRLVGVLGCGS